MGVVALALFHWGSRLSPVFVNVRLWPFLIYAIAALAALGAGLICARSRAWALPVTALLLAALTWGPDTPNTVPGWARWNYEGVERKPDGPAFQVLMDAVRGTPGRLANDLCPANACLGSSRIFELAPHLAGKPVLEGGIVNSAWGSIFAYTIQGETSRQSAGYPTLVTPAAFDMTNATRHLELFNVKHFIARWSGTRQALAAMPAWRLLRAAGEWELYELTTHDGSYVSVPTRVPVPVLCTNRQAAGYAWIARPAALDQPFILLAPGEREPPGAPPAITQDAFAAQLAAGRESVPAPLADAPPAALRVHEVTDTRIRFHTAAVGRPHIVKCAYYPNWRVRGADRVYMVTPCFMLVYPRQADVELYYGSTAADNLGWLLTVCGLAALIALGLNRLATKGKALFPLS
jgi:hypothetical protein